MFVRVLAIGVAMALLLSSCGSSGESDASSEGTIIQSPAAGDPEATQRTPEGVVIGELHELEVGDCFNKYMVVDTETEAESALTTKVDCLRPHDNEVYASFEHPGGAGEPYPGRVELNRWGSAECYERFGDFVGLAFELSRLEIGVIPPEEPNWINGPYRTVECYLFAPDSQLQGPMAQSGV